ncbi:MAG: uroporphyrinogen-III C-methyltransferase [Candidatus Heimdallarchaeota archaeon]
MVVWLVGAGPGDPDLITVKGLHLIQQADVIVYDRLIPNELLSKAKTTCEKIYVGKKTGNHKVTQEGINQILVEKGKAKSLVVRLKGGDSFVFGRGGEEAEELVKAGIPFGVVPGISSAYAVPAYAGIPITHRRFNSQVAFVTGHKSTENIDEVNFDDYPSTVVILMGIKERSRIAEELINSRRFTPSTSVAVIENGCTNLQKVTTTTIQELTRSTFTPPAILVVGEIVNLRNSLAWRDQYLEPLKTAKIAVTSVKGKRKESEHSFKAFDTPPAILPVLELQPIDDDLPDVHSFDVIVFTSQNGVTEFAQRSEFPKDKIYVSIGPRTHETLAQHGIDSLIPQEYNSHGVGRLLLDNFPERKRILLLRSDKATRELRDMLRPHHDVLEHSLYSVSISTPPDEVLGKYDVLFLTAGTAVKALAPLLKNGKLEASLLISIGATTTAFLRKMGIDAYIESKNHSLEGMIRHFLEHCFEKKLAGIDLF